MTLLTALLGFAALLISLSVHEFCHALAAYVQGDQTAQRMGRLTLDLRAHVDPIGTILVPLIAILPTLAGSPPLPVIGWAKPVPFNPYNLKHQKWGSVLVAMAGPASNFLLAFIFVFLLKGAIWFGLGSSNLLVIFLLFLVMINVVLGIFNFIPVPPLDGSKLLHALLDHPKYRNVLLFLETRGPLILLLIVFLDLSSPRSILGSVFDAAIQGVFALAGIR